MTKSPHIPPDPQEVDMTQFPKVYEDIPYASEHENQRMDIILPSGEGSWPVILFVHGGGWCSGGRREKCIAPIFKLVSQGYAIATIDYRLSQTGTFPLQIYDVKAAIRFLRAHQDEYHVSTDKLVIWGNSAGGHLSALAAATGSSGLLEDLSMGNAIYPCHVDGLIVWYGVFDFETYAPQYDQLYPGKQPDGAAAALLGENTQERQAYASPVNYISDVFPPALIQHGKSDRIVPWLQAEEFFREITEICGEGRAVLEYFPKAGHGAAEIKADDNLLRCLRFLDGIYQPSATDSRPELPELRYVPSRNLLSDIAED